MEAEVAEKLAKEVDEKIAFSRSNSKKSLPVDYHKQRNGLLQDPSQNIDGGIVQGTINDNRRDVVSCYHLYYCSYR